MLEYMRTWLALRSDKRGVTAMEYGLIAALIAVVIIGDHRSGRYGRHEAHGDIHCNRGSIHLMTTAVAPRRNQAKGPGAYIC